MTPPLPVHYAFSEALVAACAALGIAALISKNWLSALGLLPFGLAGLIGAIQIAARLTGSIASFHQFLSRAGAIFGLACLVGALLSRRDWRPVMAGLAAATLTAALPIAGMPLFGAAMLGGTIFVHRTAPNDIALMAAAGFALLAPAQLIAAGLRSAHPDLAWHVFHILVAIWLLIVAAINLRLQELEGSPEWRVSD